MYDIIKLIGAAAFILSLLSIIVMVCSKCIKNIRISDRLFVSSFYVSIISSFIAIILCIVLASIQLGKVFI